MEQSLNNENKVRVLSYPDYKETEIYAKLIEQLNKADQEYEELDLSIFGTKFNSELLPKEDKYGNIIGRWVEGQIRKN